MEYLISNGGPIKNKQWSWYQSERKLLQVVITVIAILFPLLLGLYVMVCGLTGVNLLFGTSLAPSMFPDLDSTLRFFAANFFGIGILLLWLLPRIEKATALIAIVGITLFLGGLSRVLSMLTVGKPSLFVMLVTGIELGSPLLSVWQYRIAKMCRSLRT